MMMFKKSYDHYYYKEYKKAAIAMRVVYYNLNAIKLIIENRGLELKYLGKMDELLDLAIDIYKQLDSAY